MMVLGTPFDDAVIALLVTLVLGYVVIKVMTFLGL